MTDAVVPCGNCHACCQGETVMLIPERGDDVASYDHVIKTLPTFGPVPVLRKIDGHCVYLGLDGCTIHGRAPALCRMFDCRLFYLSHTRAERRKMVAAGAADKAVLVAGRERLNTLPEHIAMEGFP